jgi:hypothetical protein
MKFFWTISCASMEQIPISKTVTNCHSWYNIAVCSILWYAIITLHIVYLEAELCSHNSSHGTESPLVPSCCDFLQQWTMLYCCFTNTCAYTSFLTNVLSCVNSLYHVWNIHLIDLSHTLYIRNYLNFQIGGKKPKSLKVIEKSTV